MGWHTKNRRSSLLSLTAALAAWWAPATAHGQSPPAPPPLIPPTPCDDCAAWNEPQRPFRIHGNTWYVGTRGLSAILVTSPDGHALIDGALPESAPLIAASIRALGFRLQDVRFLLNSHAHYDHAGGLAALQRATGAQLVLHPWSARAVAAGRAMPDDPQIGHYLPYPTARAHRTLGDSGVVRVGALTLTAHHTGGHTPGGTTWSWRACDGDRCRDVVYADSQTPISDDDFRFSSNARYPSAVADFAAGHARLEQLACDILLTPHPGASGIFERLAQREAGAPDAFTQAGACRAYAASARQRLAERLERERRQP